MAQNIVKNFLAQFKSVMQKACVMCLVGFAALPAHAETDPAIDETEQLTIGILATEGVTRALDSWTPMAKALNAAAQERDLQYRFKIAPYTDTTMIEKFGQDELDFFLADPAAYVIAEVENDARALLSVAQFWEGQSYDKTSVVVFARSDTDIKGMADIAGRSIMGVSENEMTGWKLALQEFRKYRLDIGDIESRALFSAGNQREVVYAVQTGLVDVGVIRAGVLENLDRAGIIDLNDFRPVSPVEHEDYPFWASTQLYPDWVIAAMPGLPQDVLAVVIDTLLGLDAESAESIAAGGTVWLPPQNYQSVHELLISLRARPYQNHLQRSVLRVATTYKWVALGIALLIVSSILFLILQLRKNAALANAHKEVLKSEVRSKEFYRNAVEAHTVFCMLNRDGIISHANTQFQEAVERSRNALVDHDLAEFMDAANNALLKTEVLPILASGQNWRGTLLLQKADGATTWLQCSFIPVLNSLKVLSEIAIVASDLTKTRQGVSEDRFNNTLELLQDHVIVFRPKSYEIMYANSSVSRLLTDLRTEGTWDGKTLSDMISENQFSALQERCDLLEQGPARRVTWEAQSRSGITYDISLDYAQPEGDAPRFIAIYRDVSQRKVAEKAKTEFISTVSHELRTPLTSIKGALGLVLSGATGMLPDKMKGLITIAAASCDRLILLINSILDMEKIEAGTLDYHMKVVDLSETLAAAMKPNKLTAEQANMTFEWTSDAKDGPFLAFGDPKRLVQVFDNLLSNAIKFSKPGSEVLISLDRTDRGVRVSVRDYGSGIRAGVRETIFEKFTQGDSSDSRTTGGTGLGLAIAKVIVEHHKGAISFYSEPGMGTEFIVELPWDADVEANGLPETPLEIVEMSGFTKASGTDAKALSANTNTTPAHLLVQEIEKTGFMPLYEIGKCSVEVSIDGKAPEDAPLQNEWLGVEDRSTLASMLASGALVDTDLCIVQINASVDQSASNGAILAASQLRKWFDSCAETFGNPADPLCIAAVEEAAIAEWLEREKITKFEDTATLLNFANATNVDVVLTFSVDKDVSSLMVVPSTRGRMPLGWPVCILVVKNSTSADTLGVVSKFASNTH